MSDRACACQRLDAIESQLIRLRALMAQRQQDLNAIRTELRINDSHDRFLASLNHAKAGIVPLADVEKEAIRHALYVASPLEAADLLNIGKTTLYRKVKEYGWDLNDFAPEKNEAGVNGLKGRPNRADDV